MTSKFDTAVNKVLSEQEKSRQKTINTAKGNLIIFVS